MERLSPYAVLIREHLDKTPVGRLYDVEGLFHRWDNYVQRVSFFHRYPDMTDHGRSHANNVVGLVAQLALPGGTPPLNPSEILCLTAAAWLHDIGMYTTGDTGAEDVYDAMTIRKKHSGLSRDRMREERDILFPDVPERDVRFISAIAAYHQSRSVLDEAHRAAILAVDPKADLRQDLPSLERELAGQGWADGTAVLGRLEEAGGRTKRPERVRVKLLAVLLRVLDQCDIQMNRAGNLDFLVRRADRSLQQQRVYEELLQSLPDDSPDPRITRLRRRIQDEVKFFQETHLYALRDFWVERTFIAGGRIYVKLNSESLFHRQAGLVPPSLDQARQKVEQARRALDYYWQHSRDYIEKELRFMNTYLDREGLKLEVLLYPEKGPELRELRRALRRASPCRDRAPARPAQWARPTGVAEVAAQLRPDGPARVLVVYGPPGRGKDQYVRELAAEVLRRAKEGDTAGLWWHAIERGAQVREAVQAAAEYLAAQGDFALENVFHDETLVTRRHADFCIDTLREADYPRVVVLQDINAVDDRSRWFFTQLLSGLGDKPIIATSTRWTSERNASLMFAELAGAGRFLECPRPAAGAGADLFARVARRETKAGGGDLEEVRDRWQRRWREWGGEPVFLAKLAGYAWMAEAASSPLPDLVDGAMRAHFVSVWDRISDRKLWEETLRFRHTPNGRLAAEGAPSAQILDLVDRGLGRWEQADGRDPWEEDDAAVLRTERPEAAPAVWLHPGLRRVLGLAKG